MSGYRNVCHHITKIDLPPKEMKETIFTRHYQTVLPLLANNRKDKLAEFHTSFVNTAIGNMKDNRVLNIRPPSFNDEDTLLQRRQRTTLSQLHSGHCKLLNSYKKRLKQSDSSRCPDCGMDPQDVPHLFDCVAHPNDLSPVNLWDKPFEMIRELCFLDPGNLNEQTRMAPNDTAYKRWSCHGKLKLLCKLCRTSPTLLFFGHAGHADPLDGWRCCSQKRVMSRPIQVRQL